MLQHIYTNELYLCSNGEKYMSEGKRLCERFSFVEIFKHIQKHLILLKKIIDGEFRKFKHKSHRSVM